MPKRFHLNFSHHGRILFTEWLKSSENWFATLLHHSLSLREWKGVTCAPICPMFVVGKNQWRFQEKTNKTCLTKHLLNVFNHWGDCGWLVVSRNHFVVVMLLRKKENYSFLLSYGSAQREGSDLLKWTGRFTSQGLQTLIIAKIIVIVFDLQWICLFYEKFNVFLCCY